MIELHSSAAFKSELTLGAKSERQTLIIDTVIETVTVTEQKCNSELRTSNHQFLQLDLS